MTAKTVTGGRTRVAVLGFQEFMNRVDADRLKRMPPDTFEKYLPYAMALGVEHRWAQAFAGIVQTLRPVRRARRIRLRYGLQSDFLFQFHAQHGGRHATGVRFCAAGEFDRIRLWRRRRRRILRWWIWRRRRQRVLGSRPPILPATMPRTSRYSAFAVPRRLCGSRPAN